MPRGPHAARKSVRKEVNIHHLHPPHKACISQTSHCFILPCRQFPSIHPRREQEMK